MNGGDALVATLISHGVDTVFCVPGESYLAVLEGMRKNANAIRLVVNRHESGASFAANAYAKIGRRPGCAFVSRGPGATNASIGVHTADQDSIPLVLFIGQVPRAEFDRESFQKVNYHEVFGSMAKAVMEPYGPEDVARVTAHALALSQAGRPGPVIVVLPEDVTEAEAGDVAIPEPVARSAAVPSPDALAGTAAMINGAERILVIAGELVKAESSTARLSAFATASGAAVVAAFRCQDAINNDHPAYVGLFGLGRPAYLKQAWAEADLVIVAGSRLDAITTEDYALLGTGKTMIHIHPDADVLAAGGATLQLAADIGPTLQALASAIETPREPRVLWQEALREGFETFQASAPAALGDVDMAQVIRHVDHRLADTDHVLTNDAGNFSTWLHRYIRHRFPDSQAGPMAGAMGYAVPAAVGAQLAKPGAKVIAFVGDGGFLMTGQELSTAAQYGLPVIVIVVDNGAYGTIKMHQHRYAGAGNYAAVDMVSPDFAKLGEGYGAATWKVAATGEFGPAFDAALAHDGAALIHVITDIRDIAASGPLKD
jgi:acetolactate synthase I/II/III large subunit